MEAAATRRKLMPENIDYEKFSERKNSPSSSRKLFSFHDDSNPVIGQTSGFSGPSSPR